MASEDFRGQYKQGERSQLSWFDLTSGGSGLEKMDVLQLPWQSIILSRRKGELNVIRKMGPWHVRNCKLSDYSSRVRM